MSNPKRNAHEHKPEQARSFKGSYVPSSRANPKVRAGNKDRQPIPRKDAREPVRLTGQWRHEGHCYHLFINQAGPHIEMLLAIVSNGRSGDAKDQPRDKVRSRERLIRLGGDVDPGDRNVYMIYVCNPDDLLSFEFECGTLEYSGDKRLELELDLSGVPLDGKIRANLDKLAGSSTALRIGTAANLFEGHIGQSWHSHEVRSRLWFPPTKKQLARLPGFVLGARIDAHADNYVLDRGPKKEFGYVDLVRAFYQTAADDELSHLQRSQRLNNAASALDRLVLEVYSDALGLPAADGGIDIFQLDYWRTATLHTLADTSIRFVGQSRAQSLLTHTYHILDSSPGASLGNFDKLLFLRRRDGGHYYAAEIELIDVDGAADDAKTVAERLLKKHSKKIARKLSKRLKRRIPAGALLGFLTIRKQDDPAENPKANEQPPEWEAQYAVELAGLKLSRSAGSSGVAIRSSGEAKHVYGPAWQPEQLDGAASLTDGGVAFHGGGGGKAASLTVLTCHGSGDGKPSSPLQLNFSGLADLFSPGAGVGLSFSRFGGRLLFLDAYVNDRTLEAPPEDQPFEYGSQTSVGPLHFPINGAKLFPEGERLLQVFAATELAVLARRGVKLTLDGYADQPDDRFHNKILSRNRAISALNYLKNILEDDLAVEDLSELPTEKEEESRKKKAEGVGTEYKIFDPSTTNVVIVAHGEPGGDDSDKETREYDVRFRRVDLSVDGIVSLRLRRKDDGTSH